MHRQLRADLEDLKRRIGAEDVVHNNHGRSVHHAHTDGGIGSLGEPLGVHNRAAA